MRKIAALCLLLVLSIVSLATQAQEDVQVGDEIVVLAQHLPLYVQPNLGKLVDGDLIRGRKSRVLAEHHDGNGVRWLYLEDHAYAWVKAEQDDQATLTIYSDETVGGIIAEANTVLEIDPNDINALAARGTAYQTLENYDAAISDFAIAVDLAPDEGWLRLKLAQIYRDSDVLTRATMTLLIAKDRGYVSAQTLNLEAVVNYEWGYYDRVVELSDQAIVLEPEYGMLYNLRGVATRKLDGDEAALQWYSRAIELDPYLVIAFTNRGLVYQENGAYDAALRDYGIALGLNPDCAICYRNRALVYYYSRDHLAAISDLDRALALDPSSAIAYSNRGASYFLLGDLEQGIADTKRALALEPDDRTILNIATTYAQLGLYTDALEAYASLTWLNSALLYRAQVYTALGDYAAANEDIVTYIDWIAEPDVNTDVFFTASAYIVLGAVQLHQADFANAYLSYQAALDQRWEFALNFLAWGGGYQSTPLRAEEIEVILTEIAADPEAAALYLDVAPIYFELGYWQEGIDAYESYLALEDDPAIQSFVDNMKALLDLS